VFIAIALTLAIVLLVFTSESGQTSLGEPPRFPEYDRYVHEYVNQAPYGNWTYIEKPMFPVYFNRSEISIGSNWTVVSPLMENNTYHVYSCGEWVNKESDPSTDYDIYVYNPQGELEGYHTEAAGLPEHLGTDQIKPFFTPRQSGNYNFVLRNDPRESNASEQATFMLIENVNVNEWHEVYIEGKQNNLPVFSTAWAFEFATDSQHIEVYVRVPDTLDMYEARLYLMANPTAGKGEMLNDFPLAWEPGLYGEIQQSYGGYNLESKEHRGVAYASCEDYGQDMLVNYTSPVKGKSLYHLVFIGERGGGNLDFLVKTEFGQANLKMVNPPLYIYPDNTTTLTFVSQITDIKTAALNYSANKWRDSTLLEMQVVDSRTISATLPGQTAGTTVKYEVRAADVLENTLIYRGNYTVKYASYLNVTLRSKEISIGENVTVAGQITPQVGDLAVTLVFTSANGTFKQTAYTIEAGTFSSSFKPVKEGTWLVQALFPGSNLSYPSTSDSLIFKVGPPTFLGLYGTYLLAGVGVGGAVAAVVVVYIKKRAQ
jgi:hypothetical protein